MSKNYLLNPFSTNNGYRGNSIAVGANQCRVAHCGDRLIAKGVASDIVVAFHAPSVRLAALLRIDPTVTAADSGSTLDSVWAFAETSLALLTEGLESLRIPRPDVSVSAIGLARDEKGTVPLRWSGSAPLRIERLLMHRGFRLKGTDFGGSLSRSLWLDAASGRLIVRSTAALSGTPVEDDRQFPRRPMAAGQTSPAA